MLKSEFNHSFKPVGIPIGKTCSCMQYEVLSESGISHDSFYKDCDSDVFSLGRRIQDNAVGSGVSPSFRSSRLAMTDEVNNQISNLK